jgi:methyl-accepting chemotaxis protein
VGAVSNIERHAAETMYKMRGFAFTEERTYLEEARKALAEVKESLKQTQELADRSPDLVKLRAELPTIVKKVGEYEAMVGEAEKKANDMIERRKVLDANARKFLENCDLFLSSQNEKIRSDVKLALANTANATTSRPAATVGEKEVVERIDKTKWMNEVTDLGNAIRIANWRAQAERDPKRIQDAMGNFEAIDKRIAETRAITRQALNLKQLEEIAAAAHGYRAAMTQLLDTWTAMQDLSKRRAATGEEVTNLSEAAATAGIKNTLTIATDASDELALATKTTIGGLLVATVIGALLAFTLTRGITRPINRIVSTLTEGSSLVAEASGQVNASAASLAEGASEQASSLEETSSALEQMAAMTQANASSAKEASTLANEVQQAADRSSKGMQDLDEAMTGINESSSQISKIIKVIEEIAFQTNLLALNAAVEAARAGDHGKGFAVVADEVRNLAQRAAQAARETTSLIDTSVNRARQGSEVAAGFGKAITAIVEKAAKVTELVNGIASASNEQSQGVGQIATAVSQMDKVTQGIAGASEESAAAVEELSSQADSVAATARDLAVVVGMKTAQADTAKAARTVQQNITRRKQTIREKADKKPRTPAAEPARAPAKVAESEAIPMEDDADSMVEF